MGMALSRIASVLKNSGFAIRTGDDVLLVDLPNEFGTLEVSIWNQEGEDSIQLLGGNFHTHGDIEAREYGLPNREEGILHLIRSIFSGEFKMVKIKNDDGSITKTIWDKGAQDRFGYGDDFEYHPET